ncbi:MAG TPA: aminoacyl-tRNA hydrolase [Candidatus Limnocylindria bacterium]|nr:aminoacyl-tRNA hydrolase [Candidatus Limnocylindria bacterium]
MKALVGLGNPGPEYERTRHNVGYLALDEIIRELKPAGPRKQFRSLVYEARRGDGRVVLVKPLTYMNLSGEAVRDMMRWYKLQPEDVMVLSDDIDLPPGAMRIRHTGGPGTHNGWRSILDATGSEDFPRARIGVGAPPPGWDLRDWVLSVWEKDDGAASIREAISLAAKAGVGFVDLGIQKAMNLYNVKSKPKKDAPSAEGADAV